TLSIMPLWTVLEGFKVVSPNITLLPLQAVVAIVRLLKIRTAQSHLSTRTFSNLDAIFIVN
ncbi:MAG: hypothetical protein ACI976_002983, partial [Aureispira sp.]